MATPHINAPEGAFAKTVLMPGDPLRAKFVAENFLEDAKLVTSVRNVYGFTGTYHGKPVTVMASATPGRTRGPGHIVASTPGPSGIWGLGLNILL